MGEFVGFVLLLAVGAYAAHFLRRPEKKALPRSLPYREIAERYGLTRTRTGVRGRIGAFRVKIEGSPESTIVVDHDEPIAGWLTVRRSYDPVEATKRVLTGDRYFDESFGLYGPEVDVVARFSEEVRTRFGELRGCRVDDGVMTCRTTASRGQTMAHTLERLLSLAALLSEEVHAPVALAINALEDSNPFVRRRNLKLLAQRFRDDADETLVRAIEDPVPANAYFAARTIGGSIGLDYLRRFVTVAEHDRDRLDAMRTLVEEEAWAYVYPLLETAACGDSTLVAHHAIEWIAAKGTDDDLSALLARVPPSARYLDRIAEISSERLGPNDEPTLRRLITEPDFDVAPDAQLFVIETLGRIGTLDTIPALRRFADGGVTAFRERRRAANDAIARIDGRSNTGGLTIVSGDDDVGALSVANAGTGALSEVETGSGED